MTTINCIFWVGSTGEAAQRAEIGFQCYRYTICTVGLQTISIKTLNSLNNYIKILKLKIKKISTK